MEDVLDLYAQAHPEGEPLIAMDEASKQLLGHTAPPIPPARGRPRREDYHYERRGTQNLFMFFDPLRGWRQVRQRDSRTAVDWAEEVAWLLEEAYPAARKVKLVCDNLNTHTVASLYKAFEPERARALAKRLELHHTPPHGSWLNVAEIELSVLARQCLDRRLGSAAELAREIQAWQEPRNAERAAVTWRLTTDNARIRLRHLYPPV